MFLIQSGVCDERPVVVVARSPLHPVVFGAARLIVPKREVSIAIQLARYRRFASIRRCLIERKRFETVVRSSYVIHHFHEQLIIELFKNSLFDMAAGFKLKMILRRYQRSRRITAALSRCKRRVMLVSVRLVASMRG